MARDVNRRIIEDDEALPHFTRASQNIAAAAALLRGLPGPATPEERAAAQQTESSLSRRRELDASQRTPSERPDKDASVHQAPQGGRLCTTVLVHERLGLNHDTCDTLDARRRAHSDAREEASHGYHPCRGGCYDSGEDRSPSPDLSGPQAFGRHILNRQPTFRNTLGKQTPDCGSRIIGLLAKRVERILTISLSTTFHCS